jgi:uncharacterized damage-inducible protein DinB
MTQKEIQLLFDYDQWGDIKILEAVAPMSQDQLSKDLGSSFGGIQGTLVHILSANRVWLGRWSGKVTDLLKSENFPKIEVVKKQLEMYHFEVSNYLKSLTQEKLNNPLQYTDFRGNTYMQPLYQQMQHKVNHSSYHRGQIITMMRQLGAAVVSTDLINYIRQMKEHN